MADGHDVDHADGNDEGDLPAVIMDLPAADRPLSSSFISISQYKRDYHKDSINHTRQVSRDAQKEGEDLEYSKTLPGGGKHSKDLEKEF